MFHLGFLELVLQALDFFLEVLDFLGVLRFAFLNDAVDRVLHRSRVETVDGGIQGSRFDAADRVVIFVFRGGLELVESSLPFVETLEPNGELRKVGFGL